MSIVNDIRGKISIVFSSKEVSNTTHDQVKVLKIPKQFLDGLSHFT